MKSLKIFSMVFLLALGLMAIKPIISYAEDTPVAASGFCPVCLLHGAVSKGNDHFVTEYKGKIYKFGSIEMQKEFVNNPDEYASADLDAKLQQLQK